MVRVAPGDSEVEEKTGGAQARRGGGESLKRRKKDGGMDQRKRGWGGGRERERERGSAERVSPRAPAGGTSSCLPSRRRFLLHFK